MATRQKVDEYFAAAELDKLYIQATEGMFNSMSDKFTVLEKLDEAIIATTMGKVHARLKQYVINKVSEIYCEIFTDEDLDKIIVFETSSVGKKMRNVLIIIQERTMALFLNGEIDVEAIFNEVFGELQLLNGMPETVAN